MTSFKVSQLIEDRVLLPTSSLVTQPTRDFWYMFASKIYRTMATSSPYTRSVVNAMRKLYPEALADKSFDNTGCEHAKIDALPLRAHG